MTNVAPQRVDVESGRSASIGELHGGMTGEKGPTLRMLAGQTTADILLPIISGLLLALAFMPPPLGVVAWIALVPFAAAVARTKGTLELYAGAYLGGLLFTLHGQVWMKTRLNGEGLLGSAPVDWFLNGCLLATFWPFTLFLGRRIVACRKLPMACVLPVIWVCAEFLRQEVGWIISWTPFPWLQLGVTQASNMHVIQLADLGGVWSVAAMVTAVNGALFDAISTRSYRSLIASAGILASVWLYGDFRIRQTETRPGPRVALMHVGVPAPSAPIPGADLLLWSETAYPAVISGPAAEAIASLEASAKTVHATLVIGCLHEESGRRFNAAAFIDPARGYLGCYHKRFLVPWSEFTPWSWSDNDDRLPRQLARGEAYPVFKTGEYTCSATICYDICFDRLFWAFSPKPDFFVSPSRETSDPTGYVSRMLLNMTRLRAIENRRSFVRNVEDGFSGIVTSTGEYIAPYHQPSNGPITLVHVPIDDRLAPASLAGDWLPLACLAACAALSFRPRPGH